MKLFSNPFLLYELFQYLLAVSKVRAEDISLNLRLSYNLTF